MLGLPASTEVKRIITKKKIYERFGAEMSADRRKTFDAEIARITLSNEISPVSINIAEGEEIKAFFVLHILLKQKEFDQKNISYVARMFGQKVLLVLEYEGQQMLAVWQTYLVKNTWSERQNVNLDGLNLDQVWANIVTSIAGIKNDASSSLDQQLTDKAKHDKLLKEIEKLEKEAWAERQPKKKMELKKRLDTLKAQL